MKLACFEHGGTSAAGGMGAEHTLIRIAAPSPIRAPPAGPLDKVTGSTMRRDRLNPIQHRDAGALYPEGLRADGAPEVSIAILNHIAARRHVLLSNRGRRPP